MYYGVVVGIWLQHYRRTNFISDILSHGGCSVRSAAVVYRTRSGVQEKPVDHRVVNKFSTLTIYQQY